MRAVMWLWLGSAIAASLHAQGTEGLISGRITDSVSGRPIPYATIHFENAATNTKGSVSADAKGHYVLPLLPPGTYTLFADRDKYQRRQYEELILPVAATLNIDFDLRPLTDLFESGLSRSLYLSNSQRLLGFYGPDVDTSRAILVAPLKVRVGRLESSVSDVIDPLQVEKLPFTGRNIFAALLLQPGVNADAATTRGLGLSVNGQRPSSSMFLLDGVENNNYLITGPLVTVAPEAVQEYRISTNNFSAAYGGTSGYLANAVTRSGSAYLHGLVYLNWQNEVLNANGFQRNFHGEPRAPFKETQPGFQVGGPLSPNSSSRFLIFGSAAFEYNRERTRLDPELYVLPTAETVSASRASTGAALLRRYRAIAAPDGPPDSALPVLLSAPSSLNRNLGLLRLDAQTQDGSRRLMLRAAISYFDRPDYYWSPYPDFVSGFSERAQSVAASLVSSMRSHASNEIRVERTGDLLRIENNNQNLPALSAGGVALPISTSPFAYLNNNRGWHFVDNFTAGRSTHLFKTGTGMLFRNVDGGIKNGAGGAYNYSSLTDFLSDDPNSFSAVVARPETPASQLSLPTYDRAYRNLQYSAFAQDTWTLGERLVLNYGLRYENFGAPENVGAAKDDLVVLGPGNNFPAKLHGAQFQASQSRNQPLFDTDNNDWSGRFAFSYLLSQKGSLLLRGSYGIFYDRLFDNLWQTVQSNSVVPAYTNGSSSPSLVVLQNPGSSVLAVEELKTNSNPIPNQATIFQPGLRNPQIQSAFFGLQGSSGHLLSFELNALASRGRGLLTTDLVNRRFSAPSPSGSGPRTYLNTDLPVSSYRANQGFSNYDALSVLTRFQSRSIQGQAAYTWSHTIDNQSDPLAGDFNLEFSSTSSSNGNRGRATFVQQFDSKGDIGNADFDQRHSLVFYVTASSTLRNRFFEKWSLSALGAVRSGTPFTAYAISPFYSGSAELYNNRADLIFPEQAHVDTAYPGGRQLLNAAAFGIPAAGKIGSSGRNAFRSPSTFNADFSLARSFTFSRFAKSARLTVRADAYNVFNHANLRVPILNPAVTFQDFGTAQYGTVGIRSAFPSQVPLTETARQVQILLRFQF